MEEKKEASFFRITVVLLLICGVMAGLVAGVNAITYETIQAQLKQAKENAIISIFPQYNSESETDNIELLEKNESFAKTVNDVYEVTTAGAVAGYAVDVTPKGYGGDGINLMVGVSCEKKIISVQIIYAESETPGLGQKVREQAFLDRFVGKLGGMQIKSDIEAIAGATISSKGVVAGANDALAAVELVIAGGDK